MEPALNHRGILDKVLTSLEESSKREGKDGNLMEIRKEGKKCTRNFLQEGFVNHVSISYSSHLIPIEQSSERTERKQTKKKREVEVEVEERNSRVRPNFPTL